MNKRNLFSEMMEGFDALQAEREGKLTLKRTSLEHRPMPRLSAEEVANIRRKLNVSQQVFARQLRIEARTIANWEQGISRPNAQASILLKLVECYPELLDKIGKL
ncbi:helix-turn-helix domain-containing protein [Pseudoduganella violacea]|uniref:Putative transcriptional regulator n=1 Tax=Pseudoduganella violacea TaxID=1715466 RepID=A0A7W5FUM0_9BURK|nr:helix-turn-helix domain-containing protein [Pseudoduganella violacea]MBB3119872.1 putative transcriptional regulator [Pseudoduganella violacea]